jgi:surface protein
VPTDERDKLGSQRVIGSWATSLSNAFYDDSNLTAVPTDFPAAVTNMNTMFNGATAFNQDISTWDTAAVKNMNAMFESATAFNQALGTWAVGNVTDMTDMLNGTVLSVANYDATLVGWLG